MIPPVHVCLPYADALDSDLWHSPVMIAEEKLNGWRLLVDGSRCFTRSGREISLPFCRVPEGCIVDGELVARKGMTRTDHETARLLAEDQGHLEFVAFDCLQFHGEVIRGLPLRERKRHLARLMGLVANPRMTAHAWTTGNRLEFYRQTVERGGEGVVLKMLDQPYHGRAWKKVKPVECPPSL